MTARLSYKRMALAAAVVLVLGLAGCGGGDDTGDDDDGITVVATATGGAASGGGSTGEAKTISVSMTDNKFTPNKIEVEAGKPITFIAKNDGAAIHNMKILSSAAEGKDYASEALVNPGKESKFTVTFTKKGVLKFQCDYHLPDMVGEITVK